MRRWGTSLVNLHFPGLEAFFWALLKWLRLYDGTLLLSFHGADITRIRNEGSVVERVMWRFILANSTALTACSDQLAVELKQQFHWASGKVHVVPNAVDVRRIRAESQSFRMNSASETRPYFISIAGFEPKKGLDVLVTAFARLSERYPSVRLLLICRQGPEKSDLEDLVRSLRVTDRVCIEIDVPHDRAMSLLARAEALVVPSRKEPFGIVVLEAAALSRPVIAADCCGVLESLDRSLVTVVPSNDAYALASAMSQLLENPQRASLDGARLFAEVAASFSWTRSALLLLAAAGQAEFEEHANSAKARVQ
jgi:glycogen(starch) synthase